MKKTLSTLTLGLALAGCLGAGWPTELDVTPDRCRQVTPDSPRLARSLWQEDCYLSVFDSHLGEFVSLLELPHGWIGNGGIWGHHDILVRALGLINDKGASAFVLVGPEERVPKPASQIGDKEIKEIDKSWERLITNMYPVHKAETKEGDEKISWHEFPPERAERLRKLSTAIGEIKRGRHIKLFTLTNKEDDPVVQAALIVDFDLFESTVNGKTSTLMRNRHVKLIFIPEGNSLNDTVLAVAQVANQAEKAASAWDKKLSEHLKVKATDCHLPTSKPYSINHLKKELGDIQAQPYTVRLNALTSERLRVPTNGASVWVDAKGAYLFSNDNPNSYAPMNKFEWRRIK